jgi:hypothetical protein
MNSAEQPHKLEWMQLEQFQNDDAQKKGEKSGERQPK